MIFLLSGIEEVHYQAFDIHFLLGITREWHG